MTKHLQIITQNEFDVEEVFMSFSLNEYYLESCESETKILNQFLNPEIFIHEDFHKVIREDGDKSGFLDHAFNLEKISATDFQVLNKEEAIDYFEKNVSPYGDDEDNERKIIIAKAIKYLTFKFTEIVNNHSAENFYVINHNSYEKSWDEDLNNEKLTFDANIYDVYFLIIWIDFKEMKLLVCQSLWD